MGANIEVKARTRALPELRLTATEISGTPGELIEQEDWFFEAPHARLKLRIFSPERGELISYRREDRAGAKASEYVIAPTDRPALLREALALALGVRVVVRKKRWLYVVGQTRIHLDEVAELGTFVELEYVLEPGEDPARGEREVARLLDRLGVRAEDQIAGAYADLLTS
jgi:predicted adenylyl cyclase CyaB